MCIEPGSYLVGDASVLLTRVNTIKTKLQEICWCGCRFQHITQTNHVWFIPPHSSFSVTPLAESTQKLILPVMFVNLEIYLHVTGLCLSLEKGDVLAILMLEHMHFSMSSQYNSRPKPAEILVNNEEITLLEKEKHLLIYLPNKMCL